MYDDKTSLNSIVYDVEFPDETIREYAVNVIAENMLTQVDKDGYSLSLMEGIVDYKRDLATELYKQDTYVVTRSGKKRPRKTTIGWKLLIRWIDVSEYWIHLKDKKESHMIEVAEFDKARGISDEPDFEWWVP